MVRAPHRLVVLVPAVVLALVLLGAVAPVQADSPRAGTGAVRRYVDADAEPNGDGLSWESAFQHIQCALNEAVSGDEVWVAEGIYYPDEGCGQVDNDKASAFVVKGGLLLYGGFAGDETDLAARDPAAHVTVLSGDIDHDNGGADATDAQGIVLDADGIAGTNARHVVSLPSARTAIRLDGFAITGGGATDSAIGCPDGCGGGYYSVDTSATLANLRFVGNMATFGAGLLAFGASTITMDHVVFAGNLAHGNGGGAQVQAGAVLEASNLRFENNRANLGGGALLFDTTGSIELAEFLSNQAINGAGLYIWNTDATLAGVSFADGVTTEAGGAIYAKGENKIVNVTINDARFENNRAHAAGGAIWADKTTLAIRDSTLTHNGADTVGGGLYALDGSTRLARIVVERNSALSSGGGLFVAGELVMTSILFQGNLAEGDTGGRGGAFVHGASVLDAANLVVVGNTSGEYGAVMLYGREANLSDCTFAFNVAPSAGAAVAIPRNTLHLRNCLFWGNGPQGGILPIEGATITRKAVWIDGPAAGPDADGNRVSPVNPFVRDASPGPDQAFGDYLQTEEDSSLDDDYGDMRLRPGALSIDAGLNAEVPGDVLDVDDDNNSDEILPLDLDGEPRIVAPNGGAPVVDVGGYERQHPDSATPTNTPIPGKPTPTRTPVPGLTPRAYLPAARK